MAAAGFLDSYRHVALMAMLGAFYDAQGKCERIKNTPFPRQVANFGLMSTWVFIFVLPLAFVDLFEAEARVNQLSVNGDGRICHNIGTVHRADLVDFFIMEKVSDSTEDPFEGGATDVPISALCRVIEIDLNQMLGTEVVAEPLKPIDAVLY